MSVPVPGNCCQLSDEGTGARLLFNATEFPFDNRLVLSFVHAVKRPAINIAGKAMLKTFFIRI